MFRIKPVRNTTVAKQSNISPQHSINFTLKKPTVQPINLKKIDTKGKLIDNNPKKKINDTNLQKQSFLPHQQLQKRVLLGRPKPKL
jgi:hypothetical protein